MTEGQRWALAIAEIREELELEDQVTQSKRKDSRKVDIQPVQFSEQTDKLLLIDDFMRQVMEGAETDMTEKQFQALQNRDFIRKVSYKDLKQNLQFLFRKPANPQMQMTGPCYIERVP